RRVVAAGVRSGAVVEVGEPAEGEGQSAVRLVQDDQITVGSLRGAAELEMVALGREVPGERLQFSRRPGQQALGELQFLRVPAVLPQGAHAVVEVAAGTVEGAHLVLPEPGLLRDGGARGGGGP